MTAHGAAKLSLSLIPINFVVWWQLMSRSRRGELAWFVAFSAIAAAQLGFGIYAVVKAVRAKKRGEPSRGVVLGSLAAIGALLGWLSGSFVFVLAGALGGSAWGRPLRIRGKQLHPSLREGADWTEGARPDPRDLDLATRRALEALWLHDAQKEHASVPAFSRVSWLLAAAGAPAELLVWAHRAAIEEIAHTRACFALAAGYGSRSHTVEPMPDLLLGGIGEAAHVAPRITLAIESLGDGCQLEDFNADVAARCAEGCEEPVTRAVLEQIAREERTHADFSWAVLDWLLAHHRAIVEASIHETLARLDRYPRPTAVSPDKRALVMRADADALRRHGRLPDAAWQRAWDDRLAETRKRVNARLRAQAA